MNDKKKKSNAYGKVPYRWIFLSLVAILIFVFFSYIAPKLSSASLQLNIAEKTISINTTQLSVDHKKVEAIDPKDHFVDSSLGFIFKRPLSGGWSKPKTINGFSEYLKAKNVSLHQMLIEQLEANLKFDPYGPAIMDMVSVRMTKGKTVNLKITGETTNELIERIISGKPNEIMESEKMLLRKAIIGFEEMDYTNEIVIQRFDKGILESAPIKISLPNFAVKILAGNSIYIDRLVANERTVLAGGSIKLNDVLVDGQKRSFRFDRLFLITESQEAFYMVDIGFSPDTESSLQVWEDLRAILNSFRVLEG